jgi:hypothetical protein
LICGGDTDAVDCACSLAQLSVSERECRLRAGRCFVCRAALSHCDDTELLRYRITTLPHDVFKTLIILP